MRRKLFLWGVAALAAGVVVTWAGAGGQRERGARRRTPPPAEPTGMKKWQKGKGWGWVWGAHDEVGALNEMTDASRLAALQLIEQGKVYDLGVLYDRTSYKWPGHSPGEIISFRTPEGVKRQGDLPALVNDNPTKTAWHS
ncbi:MAG: hypothetical protein NZT92_09720, partial [Abditibacteriales bacterium]|nr:hypothetical protein [Abditibacteriales bacterium]MDW8366268.1 hypothetical protein [Abditibacteriales bacterium]